ncbi:hypothetical protein MHK_006063, partial [Candidatus Magnetomorum sp. HK-1]
LSATDGELTATTSFTLTVNAVNDRPVISSVSDQIIEEDSTLFQISFTVSDIDTSDLIVSASFSNSALITNMQINGTGADRTLSLTPVTNENGAAIISLSVTDSQLTATTSFTLTVTAINDRPVISAISDQTIDEDTALSTVTITVSDLETSDLSITGISSNPTLISNSNIKFTGTGSSRTLSLTPSSNETGNAIISVSVTDGELTATTSFELTVNAINDPPIISTISDQSIDEDSALKQVNLTVTDIETTSLIVSGESSNPALLDIANLKIESSGTSRMLSLTPTSNENGSTIITLSVTDGYLTSTTSFTLTVNAINDMPTISTIDNQTIYEDTKLSQISFTVSDVESSNLIVSGISSNSTLVNNPNIKIEGSGANRSLSLTPTSNEHGSTIISISVSDGELTATTSFTLTVSEINDPPVISSVADQIINEDTELSQISFTVSDLESSDLIVSANSSNPTLVNSISIEGTDENRILSLTPTSNENGIAIISLSATDGELTANTSFTLTVNAVNDRPVISSVSDQIIEEDSTLSQISFTVSDIETSDLIVSASSSNSTLITNMQIEGTGADRTLSLTPVSNENGVSIISLSVTDGDLTATTSFTLTVSAINDDPVISAISDQTIDEDTALSTVSFTVSDIETSDLIVTGTSSNPTLVNISTIKFDDTGASRTLTLTPCSNEFGNAIISVSVSDGQLTATTSFELTVEAINDPPNISTIPDQTINEDSALTQVNITVEDIETTALIVSGESSNPALLDIKNLKIEGTGASRILSLTPTSNENGSTIITLSVTDGYLTSTTSFSLTVNAINDTPIISTIVDQKIDEDT